LLYSVDHNILTRGHRSNKRAPGSLLSQTMICTNH
jgi:hypothetical protein